MELFIVGATVASALVTARFGLVCVRYTRIFFSILTLALSQVLWSLAFKFFWVTGGTDGLRVPTPRLLGRAVAASEDKTTFLVHAYYTYVIVLLAVLCGFRTFSGPIIGAIVFNYLKTYAVGFTVYWQLLLGVFLVTLVLALPTGITGSAGQLLARLRRAA